MYRRFASADRLPSSRSEASRSPYAKNYRTNLTHDQRELLSHRQSVSKLPRRELEDRYIALMDEHFAVKKDNALNNEKIKKMATKLLRLSAEGKGRGTPFPLQLSPNENLEIQIIRLEAYNSLLKDRLNIIIRKYSNNLRSTSISGIQRPASCSNLSLKRKITLSQDELNLLEIPEPPEINSKIENRSNCGFSVTDRKQLNAKATYKSSGHQQHQQHQHQHQYPQSQSSTILENDNESNALETIIGTSVSMEDKSTLNDLKNTIQKLENELTELKTNSETLKRINGTLEEKLTNEMVTKRITENVELIEMRKMMMDCETEFTELRQQYMALRSKAETELDEEQKKLNELTNIVKREMEKNKGLSDELAALRSAANVIESIQNETSGLQVENKILNHTQQTHITRITEELKTKHETLQQTLQRNEELTTLLSEAKFTIIDLQKDLTLLKEKVSDLQQQNDAFTRELGSAKEDTVTALNRPSTDIMNVSRKSQTDECSPPMPLEPIVIVNSNTKKNKGVQITRDRRQPAAEVKNTKQSKLAKAINQKVGTDASCANSSLDEASDDDVSSDDTYIVQKKSSKLDDMGNHQPANHHQLLSQVDGTASEMSSIDSDENYRTFQKRNKKLQSSLLFLDTNGLPMDFSQRLNLLERAAFYRPLTNLPHSNEPNADHYLACNCTGIECDRQNKTFYDEIRKAVETAKMLLLKEIKANVGTDLTISETQKLSSIDDSSECREFLRVQYNLNNLYKQELELVCKSCKNQTQQLINEIDVLKTKIQNYEDKLRYFESDNGEMNKSKLVQSNQMLQIGNEQGSFELHIDSFKLTKDGRTMMSCKHGELGSLFLSWNFFDQDVESKTSVRTGPNYVFQSTTIYLINICDSFLNRLHNEKIKLKLSAVVGSESQMVGETKITFSEVLIFPQNKIQLQTKVMSTDLDCAKDHSNAVNRDCSCYGITAKLKHLGNLSIWFRLTCELDTLKQSLCTQRYLNGTKNLISHQKKTEPKTKTVELIEKEFGEANAKQKSDSKQISITINRLKLNDVNGLMQMGNIKQIFVEYSFLGYRGLKTVTVPLQNTDLSFDFCKTFSVESNDGRNHVRLTKFLQDTERSIKFNIVNDSISTDENSEESFASAEIGFGLLHLGKLVKHLGENQMDLNQTEIPVLLKTPPYHNIGYLDITITGVTCMHSMQRTREHV